MTHVHAPVIRPVEPSQILPGAARLVKITPLATGTAVGWVLGTIWALVMWLVTAVGVILGTTFLALNTLRFALYYGFLKGAHIKLEPAKPRQPSIPM